MKLHPLNHESGLLTPPFLIISHQAGGAPHLHPVLEANFGPALNIRRRTVQSISRKCEDWPQAGWGPGSLTVSRPPQTAKSHAFVVPPAAVTTALKITHGADRQATATQPAMTADDKRRNEGSARGDMVAFVREGRLEHTSLVWVDSTTTARLVSREKEELRQFQKDNKMENIVNVQEDRTGELMLRRRKGTKHMSSSYRRLAGDLIFFFLRTNRPQVTMTSVEKVRGRTSGKRSTWARTATTKVDRESPKRMTRGHQATHSICPCREACCFTI